MLLQINLGVKQVRGIGKSDSELPDTSELSIITNTSCFIYSKSHKEDFSFSLRLFFFLLPHVVQIQIFHTLLMDITKYIKRRDPILPQQSCVPFYQCINALPLCTTKCPCSVILLSPSFIANRFIR